MEIVNIYPSIESKGQIAVLLHFKDNKQIVLTHTPDKSEIRMLLSLLNDLLEDEPDNEPEEDEHYHDDDCLENHSWECSEGTLHKGNEECHCKEY